MVPQIDGLSQIGIEGEIRFRADVQAFPQEEGQALGDGDSLTANEGARIDEADHTLGVVSAHQLFPFRDLLEDASLGRSRRLFVLGDHGKLEGSAQDVVAGEVKLIGVEGRAGWLFRACGSRSLRGFLGVERRQRIELRGAQKQIKERRAKDRAAIASLLVRFMAVLCFCVAGLLIGILIP